MAATLSSIKIVSDNPKYPQNKVELSVDNDLSLNTTVVVPNTSFPFIVEFENCTNALGKRFISDRFFRQLSNSTDGAYKTDRGKIFSTLQKDFTIYPYLKLNYQDFIDKVKELKEKTIKERGEDKNELEYYGANIDSFENITPEFLLQWLDLPLTDSSNQPINTFPLLLSYSNKENSVVDVVLIDRKVKDFFATTYFVKINYPDNIENNNPSTTDYNNYVNEQGSDFFNGESSKQSKLDNTKKKNKSKTISNILSNVDKFKGTILGGASLVAAAIKLKQKLSTDKLKKPEIPQKKIPNFAQNLVKRKTKKAEQKPRKRKRLSGKKIKPITISSIAVPPVIVALKEKAGTLKNTATQKKQEALNRQQQIINTSTITNQTENVVSYMITSSINYNTIILVVSNNFGAPSFSKEYSATTFTQESAKADMKFALDNFGYYDSVNGSYPKTGAVIPK